MIGIVIVLVVEILKICFINNKRVKMKFKDYKNIANKIYQLYDEMDKINSKFSKLSNLSCSNTCGGICCQSNEVEVSPVDLIPLALEIIEKNEHEEMLPKLYLDQNNHCFFWKQGKCSIYKNRAVLCRLFGTSAVFNKNGALDLSICSYIKQENKINLQNIDFNEAPNIVTYSTKINNLMPEWDSRTRPFNQALIYTLERILNSYYWENSEDNNG